MDDFKYKTAVIKVGTHVLTKADGLLDEEIILQIVSQIATLKRAGVKVILVSSGAMGAGRALIKESDGLSDVVRRQLLAAVGQVQLMNIYAKYFSAKNYLCAQVLAAKEDFRDRRHYLNMKNCFEALLRDDIVPIVNENDVVSVGELMFTDNDELAGLIAAMMNVDALIILTTVSGVLDEQGKLIPEVNGEINIEEQVSPGISKMGRGGMRTKCRVALKVSSLGIPTYIVDGRQAGVLITIAQGKKIGTFFPAAARKSNVKKWIAQAQGQEKGEVWINKRAQEVLCEKGKAASLLPVGVTKVEGDFNKGDIIKIRGEKGKELGYGVAQYGAQQAREYIGKKGKRELVHYDYLYLQV